VNLSEEVTAFVLAGGKSTRMGRDKAFLPFRGKTLLAYALETAASAAGKVYIVGSRSKFAPYAPVIEDFYAERGPLGGIHTALNATMTDLNLILAVDLPFMPPDFLLYLIERMRVAACLVAVARVHGRLQPLCAAYRRAFCSRAEENLRAGQNKIDALFSPADTLIVEEAELARLSFPVAIFDNVNTREEYDRLNAAGL
jgi:molybdopterin-guanine dinucleotide biosynthesis protein A